MADRIDALAGHDRNLRVFRGEVLEDALDDELQAIVTAAAAQLGAPVSLISLVLDHIQYFRAHHGLTPELAAFRAAPRDTTFCQLVVRDDAPLEVNDALEEDHLPQALIERCGLRAYLGVPLRVDGEVLGTLCVTYGFPRTFTPDDRARLRGLADRAEARLAHLATRDTPYTLFEAALGPIVAHLRNELTPLHFVVDEARAATHALGALFAAFHRGERCLEDTLPSLDEALATLNESLAVIEATREGLLDGVIALEATTSPRGGTLRQTLDDGAALARHATQHVDGIDWTHIDPSPPPDLPAPIVNAIVSAALSHLAEQMRGRGLPGPIRADARYTDGVLGLRFDVPGLGPDAADALRRHFDRVGIDPDIARVEADATRIKLVLPGRPIGPVP